MFSMNPPTKVFATHISNATGYILPVKENSWKWQKNIAAQVIIDASQSLGLLDVNMNNLMADFTSFCRT
ncbi:MAG: aminotransferase class V-fold PLP-dependent enzyme [Eubacterium ventriosum]